MNLSEKLKKVIKDKELKDSEFALATGISIDRVRNLCHGKAKKLQPHEKDAICNAYGVRQTWWENDKAPQYLSKSEIELQPSLERVRESVALASTLNGDQLISAQVSEILFLAKSNNAVGIAEVIKQLITNSAVTPDGFILVPHYEVRASAGHGAIVHSEQIVDYLAFKDDWVRNTLGVAQKDLALISVKGDSMEPTLSNEDLILIDMRKNRVEDNAIYVLQLDGTLLVKRIQRKLDGTLHVMSDNSRYQPEIVGADRSADLHVLGRVVWSGRRM